MTPAAIHKKLDWLYKNQPANKVAIEALRAQLPALSKPSAPPVSAPLKLDAQIPKGEVACVWEVNLQSILPILEQEHGQLHQVRSQPDGRGCCRVHLFPFQKARSMQTQSRAGFSAPRSRPDHSIPAGSGVVTPVAALKPSGNTANTSSVATH